MDSVGTKSWEAGPQAKGQLVKDTSATKGVTGAKREAATQCCPSAQHVFWEGCTNCDLLLSPSASGRGLSLNHSPDGDFEAGRDNLWLRPKASDQPVFISTLRYTGWPSSHPRASFHIQAILGPKGAFLTSEMSHLRPKGKRDLGGSGLLQAMSSHGCSMDAQCPSPHLLRLPPSPWPLPSAGVAPFPHQLEDVGGDPSQGQYSQAPTPRKETTSPRPALSLQQSACMQRHF